jgi:hypothetical protein
MAIDPIIENIFVVQKVFSHLWSLNWAIEKFQSLTVATKN